MIVTVLPFASVKDILQCDKKQLTLQDGTSVNSLMKELAAEHSSLENLKLLFAVNSDYVETKHILIDGDELAIFPPVSGG
ncbi:MAG: molybdopterin converting factor subunit 1 [Spirochaetia bacterium]|jgi:molybdopterin synthase sulfur carrier subunit|nr:molybdopterin converting factor subunit 1 [Spirochaetia bacterium]